MNVNTNYANVKESYLFSEVGRRLSAFIAANPDRSVIKMGIGDVTRPLCPAVIDAMKRAVDEMARPETFRGYGPEQGYLFLREAVQKYYASFGVTLDTAEIFISDGAKSDLGNILDLCGRDNTVLIPDPVYPVYVDTNTMDGRRIVFADATPENGFLPMPKDGLYADIVYLCSPNNPTGAVYTKEQLQAWVDWANERGALILFDAAYESFVCDPALPRSILSVPGAETCAVEFCSFSKTAGFTGTRCGYTVVPSKLVRSGMELRKMWLRRQSTKFNGVPYIVQRGAEAVFTAEGQAQVRENINYYRENARIMTETMDRLGLFYTGGKNSPYVWFACPDGAKSWDFFDELLSGTGIAGTPGCGFGVNGEGFFRLTAFNTRENTAEAMRRFAQFIQGSSLS